MFQIIAMILIVGFFAKMSNRPGMPLWVVYLFKSVTLLLFLYIIFILVASFAGVQIAAIVSSIKSLCKRKRMLKSLLMK